MTQEIVVALVQASIPFLGGLYGTLLAYRVLGKRPGQDMRWDQWYQRFGRHFRYVGPLLMLFGVFLFFIHMPTSVEPPIPPPDWRRYTLMDGTCSARIPPKTGNGKTPAAG